MGAKPASLPRWADVGGALVIPAAGKLNVGWLAGERPPAQYLNWWQNLVYLWIVFLDQLFTSGGSATGNMTLTGTTTVVGQTFVRGTSEATTAATFLASDPSGPARFIIDHLGYEGGNLSTWDEHWRTSSVADWVIANTGAGTTATATDPTSNITQRFLGLFLPGAAGVQDAKYTPNFFTNYIDNTTALVLETTLVPPALIAGTVVDFGVQFSHAAANDWYATIRFSVGSNIQFGVIGSATSFTTSAVAISANVAHRLRLEITGSLINGLTSGTFKIRAFVNGTLLGSTTFTSPAADKVRPVIRGQCTASGGNTWSFGRLRYQFNHVLTSDTY